MKIKTTLLIFGIMLACLTGNAQITATITVSPGTTVCDTMPVTFNLNIAGACTVAYKVNWIVNNLIRDSCNSCTSWTTNLFPADTQVYCNVNCNPMGNDNSNSISMTVTHCTGIAEYENGTKLKLYPNPSLGNIVIDAENLQMFPATLTISNTRGKTVNVPYHIKEHTIVFSATQFENGTYYYRIADKSGGVSATGKFVISK